jgi:hypothetical protein
MRVHRWIWRSVAGGVLVVALATGVIVLPLAVWMVLAVLAVPFGLMLLLGSTERTQAQRLHAVKLTFAGYLVIVAAIVLVKFLGVGALLIFGLLAASSPSAVAWYGGRLGARSPQKVAPDITSTDQLCRQWLHSYDALTAASTSQARLRIVMDRQRCLDELERRDPDGLRAWLASSASAGGDPRRFLSDTGPGDIT